MAKLTTPSTAREARRHNPLENDILATGILRSKSSKGKKSKDEEDHEDTFVNAKASRNILALGRELAEEDQAKKPTQQAPTIDSFAFGSRLEAEPASEDNVFEDEEGWGDEDEVVEEIELDPQDRETFNRFLPDDEDPLLKYGFGSKPSDVEEGPGTNLADLILEKIAAFEATEARRQGLAPPDDEFELPPKVVEVYSK
jgi:essential nuclear protein 1